MPSCMREFVLLAAIAVALHGQQPTPPAQVNSLKGIGVGNPLIIRAYTFIPKSLDRSRKQPLIVFCHQAIHANEDTRDAHIFRELIQQGYSIVAPDYRGSSGYGRQFYEQIDYGGREVEDVYLGMQWMLESYSFLDPRRVGIVGWTQAFAEAYYAGVPVSDLVARMGYEPEQYRAMYSAPYHIEALMAEGKKFEYKIYQNAPGGHYFNRIDTQAAKQSRMEVYRFLAGYLKPAKPGE